MADGKLKTLFESSLFLTIISLIVGLIARALAIKYGGAEAQQLSFLIGMAGVIITLQVGNLYRHREITDQLTALKGELFSHSQKLEQHYILKENIAFLEPAITDQYFLDTLCRLANSYKRVQQLKQQHERCKEFFEWKENSIFEFMLPELEQLAQQRVIINNESKELTTNKDFLIKLPLREVRAVSYQDDGFWDEPEGKDFLEAHIVMIEKRVIINRIFILTKNEITSQRAVIEEQIRMQINVRIIEAEKLKDGEREDFVIYDDTYVRFARLYEDTGTNTLKHATLIMNPDKVKEFIERYKSLYARSTDATDFYTKLDFTPLGELVSGNESQQ